MRNNKSIYLLSVLFVAIIILTAIHTYQTEKDLLLQNIDKELLIGAKAVPLILPQNYHNKNLHSISPQKDLKNIKRLQHYVQNSNLAYIYSFIEDANGTIRFASSSAPQEDIDANKSDIYSFDPYESATLREAFDSNKIIYETTQDRWGSFRSVFVPLRSEDGRKYVVGADYRLDSINLLALYKQREILWIFLPLLVMLVIYFIIIYLQTKNAQDLIAKQAKKLQTKYETDALTALPNRTALLGDIKQNKIKKLALLDINNFSAINDIYGFEISDKYIIAVGKKLQTLLLEDMKLYKLHGDIFCITLSDEQQNELFKESILSILTKLEDFYFAYQTYSVSATYTAGLSCSLSDANPLLTAESALAEAKKSGQKLLVYTSNIDHINNTLSKKQVVDDINYAIENDKIYPFYQPIYTNKEHAIYKYEALMRLETKSGEVKAPYYFLEISIYAGLYKKLSAIMFEKVLKMAESNPDAEFSINISAIDIETEEIAQNIVNNIVTRNLQSRITLEILESEDFQSFEHLLNFTKLLQKHGIKIAIDDFGSGYSNFANLVEVNYDYIKIDGSLVKNIFKDDRYEFMIKKIVEFAKDLDSKVIAEFVENKEIAQRLEEIGIEMLQGYYISKPAQKLLKDLFLES